MSKIAEYSSILTERGMKKLKEVKEHLKKGEYEIAREKTLQAAEDIFTVEKVATIVAKNQADILKQEVNEMMENIETLKRFGYEP